MAAQPALDMQVQHLYEQMKCSHGGVMLLVRLRADMSLLSESELTCLVDAAAMTEFEAALVDESRLAVTYKWLNKQFGPVNAARAVVETADALLHSEKDPVA